MEEELLLIPGPTNLSPRVRAVMGAPQVGHSSPKFYDAFKELLELTADVFMGKHGLAFVISGSGTCAMESVVASLIEPGDKVMVLDTGAFGQRFALINQALGADVEVLPSKLGSPSDPKILNEKLSSEPYKAVFVTHVDTSSTVSNPVIALSKIIKNNGALCIIDGVCSIGGSPFNFEELGIDVGITASQKALGAPPGAALIFLADNALTILENRKSPIRSYYFDLTRWRKVMEDPRVYLATPATQIMLALREALLMVKEEGLEKRWKRHGIISEAFRTGIKALGMQIVAEPGFEADTVTGCYTPNGLAAKIQSRLTLDYNILVAMGFGPERDHMLRIGHFGNLNGTQTLSALSALEATLKSLEIKVERDALAEATTILAKLS
ncbi:MAG: alanine--glyoxylate aminotransferase family protein [Thaumarchaeota archaeon]|nr:alanine--glyoxylate aminotransferase family protein [Nitrososphaerota archaeon]